MASGVIIDGLPQFQRRLAAISNVGDAAFMRDIGAEFALSARRLAPEDTGALRSSIGLRSATTHEAVIGAGGGGVDYAPSVEYGSRQHRIFPRRARRLAFFWEKMNKNVVFQSVNKDAQPAQPFFQPVIDTINLATKVTADVVTRWNRAA